MSRASTRSNGAGVTAALAGLSAAGMVGMMGVMGVVGVVGVVGGCAVLTIDVDVYKGPLANEKSVQVQQVAVMAIGAKPLIQRYRDEQEERANFKDYERYKRLAKDGRAIRGEYTFESGEAQRANLVLRLYEDRVTNPMLAGYITMAREGRDQYLAALRVLRPERTPDERWALMRDLGLDDLRLKGISGVPDENTKKRHAFAHMLAPAPVSYAERASWAFEPYERTLVSESDLAGLRDQGHHPEPGARNTNLRFRVISTESWLRAQAEKLFPRPDGADEREHRALIERFVREAKAVALAFGESRRGIAKMLEAVLSTSAYISENAGTVDEPAKVQEALAGFASYLISLNQLADVVNANKVEFQELLPENERTIPKSDKGLEDLGRRFPKKYEKDPGSLSAAILKQHLLLRDSPGKDSEGVGLARGPTLAAELLNAKAIDDAVSKMTDLLGDPFEKGRLDDGLETLIERYVNSVYRDPREADPETQQARERLFQSLVQFAEKSRFLANHSVLVDEKRGRRDLSVLEAVANSILVQVNELREMEQHGRESASEARILRAVHGLSDGSTADESSAASVYDRLVANLEKDYIDQIKTAGVDDEKAKHIKAALDEVRAARAGAVFIRPPSAFLKNSYPVSGSQTRGGYGPWKNEPGRQGARTFPFADHFFHGDWDPVQAVIDKQFWQNINTIRVAASGVTNYVVAKDDVGNWYVKNYSGDPEPIIKAAKAAAKLALANGPLSSAALPTPPANADGTPPVPRSSGSPPASLVDRLKASSEEAVFKNRRELIAFADKVDERLIQGIEREGAGVILDADVASGKLRAWLSMTNESPLRNAVSRAAAEDARFGSEDAENMINLLDEYLLRAGQGLQWARAGEGVSLEEARLKARRVLADEFEGPLLRLVRERLVDVRAQMRTIETLSKTENKPNE